MLSFDYDSVLKAMLSACQDSLKDRWPAIATLATSSLKSLAQVFMDIEAGRHDETISPEKAELLFDMQKNAFRTVLLSEEGLGLIAAQKAMNAALDAVGPAVNKAIGLALL